MTGTEAGRRLLTRPALWIGGAAVVVAVTAVTTAVVYANSDGPVRGELSATLAAEHFVTAVNAGDRDAAAAVACDDFADDARGAAVTGHDPGISFTLDAVHVDGADTGTAELAQRMSIAGQTQRHAYVLHLQRIDGRWLVCGES